VTAAHALAAAGFPFSGIDVVFSALVGVLLLVVVVGARVAISRSQRPAQPRPVRVPRAVPERARDVAAGG
jgi:hypothetical protein